MAQKKETLQAFGGNLSIEEFRKDFMTIKKIDLIQRCFESGDKSNEISITNSIEKRRWTYCFNETGHVMALKSKKEEETIEEIGKPVVYKRVTKYKTLL